MRLPSSQGVGEKDASAFSVAVKRRAHRAQREADLKVGHDEGRRHDLESEHARQRSLLDHLTLKRAEAFGLIACLDPFEHSRKKRTGAAAGVENIDAIRSQTVF